MKTQRELLPQFIWSVLAISLSATIVTGMFTINSSLAHESESLVQDTISIHFDDWIYTEDIDLITGENRSIIFTPSFESSRRFPSTTGILGSVSVIRTSEDLNVYFAMGDSYRTEEPKPFVYRFDDYDLIGISLEVHRGDSLALPANKTDSFIKSAVE